MPKPVTITREERPVRARIIILSPISLTQWSQLVYPFTERCTSWMIHNDSVPAQVLRYAFEESPGIEFLTIAGGDIHSFVTRAPELYFQRTAATPGTIRFLAWEWMNE